MSAIREYNQYTSENMLDLLENWGLICSQCGRSVFVVVYTTIAGGTIDTNGRKDGGEWEIDPNPVCNSEVHQILSVDCANIDCLHVLYEK